MKLVLAFAAVACALASQTEYVDLAMEIPAPPGESNDEVTEMIQEKAGAKMRDDVVYRISWNTKYDPDPAKTSSKGTYKINIKSVDGATETGEKTLVTHPGYQCGAASDPECFPDITGAVLADGDASAKWEPFAGTVQHYFLKATDVGEVGEVILSGDSNTDDSWTPGFLKINMNDMETGVGNGIYYMDIGKKII